MAGRLEPQLGLGGVVEIADGEAGHSGSSASSACNACTPAARGLGSRIQAHFAHLGGVELELPERTSRAQPAGFEGGEAAK